MVPQNLPSYISEGGADVYIVLNTLKKAELADNDTMFADDTDVRLILLYHYREGLGNIYFHYESINVGAMTGGRGNCCAIGINN